MPTHNSNLIQGGFKPSFGSTSWVELYLTEVHGDLHEIIPVKLNYQMTQAELAIYLSTPQYRVTESWLSRWLSRNGYNRRWVRRQGEKS